MSPSAKFKSSLVMRSWPVDVRPGSPHSPVMNVAMDGCSHVISGKPTKAAILISSKPALVHLFLSQIFFKPKLAAGLVPRVSPRDGHRPVFDGDSWYHRQLTACLRWPLESRARAITHPFSWRCRSGWLHSQKRRPYPRSRTRLMTRSGLESSPTQFVWV